MNTNVHPYHYGLNCVILPAPGQPDSYIEAVTPSTPNGIITGDRNFKR